MPTETRRVGSPEPGKWSTTAGSDLGIARYLGVTETLNRKRETRPAAAPVSNDDLVPVEPKAA